MDGTVEVILSILSYRESSARTPTFSRTASKRGTLLPSEERGADLYWQMDDERRRLLTGTKSEWIPRYRARTSRTRADDKRARKLHRAGGTRICNSRRSSEGRVRLGRIRDLVIGVEKLVATSCRGDRREERAREGEHVTTGGASHGGAVTGHLPPPRTSAP